MCKFNKKSAITFIAALFMFAIGTPHAARAVGIDCGVSTSDTWYEERNCSSSLSNTNSCRSGKDICYQMVYQGTPQGSIKGEKSCTSCPSGYRLTERSESIGGPGCTFTYNVCEEILPYSVTDANSTDSYTCSTTTYAGGSTYCPSSTQSGGTAASNCSASNYFCYQYKSKTASAYTKRKQTYCTSCRSGYELQKTTVTRTGCTIEYNTCVKVTPCDGLACEGMTTWRNDTSTAGTQMHRQIRCDTSTNKCEYRCRTGYYNASYAQDAIDLTDGGQTLPSIVCKACPTHDGIMSCSNAGGGAVCCNSGYYRNVTETTCTIPTGTGGVSLRPKCYTANCIKCPTLGLNEVEAESLLLCYPTLSEGSDIEKCYIPKDTDITDSTGTYIFEGDITDECYWDPDVLTGIIGPGGGGTIVTP